MHHPYCQFAAKSKHTEYEKQSFIGQGILVKFLLECECRSLSISMQKVDFGQNLRTRDLQYKRATPTSV